MVRLSTVVAALTLVWANACANTPSDASAISPGASDQDAGDGNGEPSHEGSVQDGGAADTDDDDGSAAQDGALPTDGSAPGDSSVVGDPEYLVAYLAGTASTGPGGLNGLTGLQSSAREVAIFSNGDYAVAGDEEYNAGGSAGIRSTDSVYVFDGATGALRWKDIGNYLSSGVLVASDRKLAGIDDQDALYPAGYWQAAKVTQAGKLEWATPVLRSGQPLYSVIQTLGGAAAQSYCTGAAVTGDGTTILVGSVAGDLTKPGSWGLAQSVSQSGAMGWTVSESNVAPYTRPWVGGSNVEMFAVDRRSASAQGGERVAIWSLDVATGSSVVTTVTSPSSVSLPATDAGGYALNWSAVAAARLPDATYALAAHPSYYDDETKPIWLMHVASNGALLAASALANDEAIDGIATTPEGFVVLGRHGSIGAAVAHRFDASLTLLGEHDVSAAPSQKPAEWRAGATRDGATVLVGLHHPAMPQSAADVMLLERTHLPPRP